MIEIQPAVKQETRRITLFTAVGVVAMWVLFGVFHLIQPETVPFDYTVFLGGIVGGAIAVLNFFLMGLTGQKVASTENEDDARAKMKASYTQRLMLQILWIVLAIVAPCFQFVAGIAPLMFPSLGIKSMVFWKPKKQKK